ncbi:hypothetical protein BJX64DRAFT_155666 [Aspergillus heterothallicus]
MVSVQVVVLIILGIDISTYYVWALRSSHDMFSFGDALRSMSGGGPGVQCLRDMAQEGGSLSNPCAGLRSWGMAAASSCGRLVSLSLGDSAILLRLALAAPAIGGHSRQLIKTGELPSIRK